MIRILLLLVLAGLSANTARAAGEPLPRDDVVNVKAYGAKGDGRTDDTASINAAFAHARTMTAVAGGLGYNVAKIMFPNGEYLVTAPVDATGFIYAGLTIEGGGAIIYGKVPGGVILDALGDRFLKIDNLTIHGDATIVA
ncbi:MAG: glycosyl hydrolase family 28-related protein, partial [Acetobacteraceae bacterium]